MDFSEKVSDFSEARHAAELVTYHLKDLQVERIGVDGLPGSVKSILAPALALRLGMEWVCPDHRLYTNAAAKEMLYRVFP